MGRPYWHENCTYDNMETTKLHEALHASVAGIFGFLRRKIVVRADCSGYSDSYCGGGWKQVAIWLAPVLIDDISWGDEEWLEYINPHRRGYAWNWLKKNRKRIMARAKRLVAKMGDGPGNLIFNGPWDNTAKCWKSSRRTKGA